MLSIAVVGAVAAPELWTRRPQPVAIQLETLTFESDNDVVDAVLLGGPVALAAKRFTGDVWKDVRRDFLSSISSYKGADRSYRIPGEFVTVKGIRP